MKLLCVYLNSQCISWGVLHNRQKLDQFCTLIIISKIPHMQENVKTSFCFSTFLDVRVLLDIKIVWNWPKILHHQIFCPLSFFVQKCMPMHNKCPILPLMQTEHSWVMYLHTIVSCAKLRLLPPFSFCTYTANFVRMVNIHGIDQLLVVSS